MLPELLAFILSVLTILLHLQLLTTLIGVSQSRPFPPCRISTWANLFVWSFTVGIKPIREDLGLADTRIDFKSYKGHHVLLFGDAYFTSIIGPNGSGKSNA
jgi:hypothetical protein